MRNLMIGLMLIAMFCTGYLVAPLATGASINLATPYTVSGPNIAAATDSAVSLTGLRVDSVSNVLSAVFRMGNVNASGVFTADPAAPATAINFYLNTGQWRTGPGKAQTLTPTQIASLQSVIGAAITNSQAVLEPFATSAALFGANAAAVAVPITNIIPIGPGLTFPVTTTAPAKK